MPGRTERVRHAVERFNAGDYEDFLAIFSPDVVLVADPQVADRSEYHGRDGVLEWIAEAHARWRGVRFVALAMEPIGETMLIELAVVGDAGAGCAGWRLYVLMRWAEEEISEVRAHPSRAVAVADAVVDLIHPDYRQAVRDASAQAMVDGAIRDVTDQRRAERWLHLSESRYRLIVENANDGIWVLDGEGRTDFVNARVCELLGRAPEELLGRAPEDFTDADGAAALASARDREEPRGSLEIAFVHADGSPLWVALSTSRYDAPWGRVQVHVLTDLTQRRHMEDRLRHAAECDALTGVWNRTRFEEMLSEQLRISARGEGSTAVVFLDLDHFKYVNDALGHQVGDRLLQRVAELFAALLREGDELARISGDGFAVLMPGADQSMAIQVADRLLAGLREERWRGTSVLRASAGLAVAAPGDGSRGAGDLMIAADIALHHAKQDGRNRLAVYAGERGGFTWLGEIRAAIEEERMVLYSQAIVPLTGGRHSEELLVRMVGRDGQLIQPVAFVPPAEQFGLMVEIDRWVVSRALELAGRERAVEINLSGQSLGDDAIREEVEAAVAAGVRAELLTFEITETAAARNLDVAREFSEALTRLGCGLAIDDFGTGFGSLIYLRHLPITRVKIDTQFVREMLSNPGDERVVAAIVSTARAMGQATVAEGVEDAATLARLMEMGVDYAQGFHIQRPAPVAALQRTAGLS